APQTSIGAETEPFQIIAPIERHQRSISPAKQSRRDEGREGGRRSILDLRPPSRPSWLSFYRSRESIRNVCGADYRVDASRRRAPPPPPLPPPHSPRPRLSLNMNLWPPSRLSLNLNFGPRPSHRPSRASCPLMNFSAFLSLPRPRQRLSWANVTADSARLT